MNTMLTKIPALEEAELEIETLVESVRPEGETERSSPQWWMTEEQKVRFATTLFFGFKLVVSLLT